MKNQNTSIMGATEYCLQSIQNLKKGMTDHGGKNQKVAMAVGGLIMVMISNLLKISQEVIEQAAQNPEPNAKNDLKEIQAKFNSFLTDMIGE